VLFPGIACFILAFAKNKVEGLTISKLAGLSLLALLLRQRFPHLERIAAIFRLGGRRRLSGTSSGRSGTDTLPDRRRGRLRGMGRDFRRPRWAEMY
jgi:hypothetical protein